jgi:tRNA A37 threonylcarbamoyladenosine modification protein TsaB
MYILAIDGSTKATGIAIFDDNKLVHYDCILCNKTNTLDRIDYMTEEI